MTKTVLQVLPRLNSGGVERGTVELDKYLRDKGWNSIVCSEGGALVSPDMHHISLDVASKNPLTIIKNIFKLESVIRQNKVDIVHARSRAPAWSAYFAAKRAGVPFVTTVHSTYSCQNAFKRWYNGVMVKGVRTIVASDYMLAYIQKHFSGKFNQDHVRIIPRGLDPSVFNPSEVTPKDLDALHTEWGISGDTDIILLPGRQTRRKGHLLALDAFKPIAQQAILVMVGEFSKSSTYYNQIVTHANELGIFDRVRIFDNDPNIRRAYAAAKIVLIPSQTPEAFGRTVIEAQAMGCTVVSSDFGTPKYLIEDGKTGWLVPYDSVTDWTDKIKQTLESPRMPRHIEHTLEKMCSSTVSVYKEVTD
ncbi:MAG: glycosyltransferase [Alphaproteobacteria bacterium]